MKQKLQVQERAAGEGCTGGASEQWPSQHSQWCHTAKYSKYVVTLFRTVFKDSLLFSAARNTWWSIYKLFTLRGIILCKQYIFRAFLSCMDVRFTAYIQCWNGALSGPQFWKSLIYCQSLFFYLKCQCYRCSYTYCQWVETSVCTALT